MDVTAMASPCLCYQGVDLAGMTPELLERMANGRYAVVPRLFDGRDLITCLEEISKPVVVLGQVVEELLPGRLTESKLDTLHLVIKILLR